MPVVRAAGGLLWRPASAGPEVALVHRPRRDDWSLPKGKLDDGEGWEEAALREVEEETGCVGRIVAFAGATSYLAKRAPKLVLYWHMALVRQGELDAGDETDEVIWLPPAKAIAKLDYEDDRRLLARARPGGVEAGAGPGSAEVAAERADVLRRVLALGPRGDAVGLGPALDLLDRADDAARAGDRAGARLLLLAARRLALLAAQERELSVRAEALREESSRLAPWRRRAVRKLLPAGARASAEAVVVASALRDEEDGSPTRPPGGGRIAAGALVVGGALAVVLAVARPELRAALLAGGGAGVLGGLAVGQAGRLARWLRLLRRP